MEDFANGVIKELPPELNHYEGFVSGLQAAGGQAELQLAVDRGWNSVPFDSPDAWWRGVLDYILVRTPVAHVYDWKTGKEYDDHYDQKQLYALGVFCTYPEVLEVRAVHVYLDTGRNTERVYSRYEVPSLRAQWEDRAGKALNATEFFPNPNYGCRWCGYSRSKGGPCRF